MSARQSSAAKIAYSVRCPSFRMIIWIKFSVAQEICGLIHRKNGTRKREVCSADKISVEPTKISAIQRIAGIQYLTNLRTIMFESGRTFHRFVTNTKLV